MKLNLWSVLDLLFTVYTVPLGSLLADYHLYAIDAQFCLYQLTYPTLQLLASIFNEILSWVDINKTSKSF